VLSWEVLYLNICTETSYEWGWQKPETKKKNFACFIIESFGG
jgi:hypothetical protein